MAIAKVYYNRLATLKKGLNYSNVGDYKAAVENYRDYLKILAAYHEVDINHLSPSILSGEDTSELFLLSQVYWYMVKIYDRNPKVYGEFKSYMGKFVLFSKGQKFQYVNSEVLRRYITKGQANNSRDFIEAYKSLKTKNGNCFIATYLYGNDHPITENLRTFRDYLLKNSLGTKMVRAYYASSPNLLRLLFKRPKLAKFLTPILRPIVYLTHLFWNLAVALKLL